jgi:AmmeMemoRadiSam system protein A
MHPVAALAKKALEAYVQKGEVISPSGTLTTEMEERAGVFVCLKERGQLRGCIGTFLPSCRSVAEEVIRNAIAAGTEDPRFPPINSDELHHLTYSVDLLSAPERIHILKELDPGKYGVIVVSGNRKGLLLPDIEGVDTAEEQLRIAKMKAGIHADEDVEIYRFEVRRYC